MYYYQNPYPVYPSHPGYQDFSPYPYQQAYGPYQPYRQYPPVNTETFTKSIKSFRLLMEQGSILLDHLGNQDFDTKIMEAAQQGNKTEVDRLIKSIGLKVPVNTKFTPTGITFELTTNPDPNIPANCCTLSVHMKWGN
ncbi:hypothetical protein [Bacillus sp. MRMR6]|uniref:hypothetical protein n=1 Tax=Bacillus sp. MRMR6 TaxID=1928617 RepID=UPI0009FA7B49|nr:hypothetical protein [Bacillus sp. MRMR6]